jgi:nucleoside-diphosphate-sugar epimerase
LALVVAMATALSQVVVTGASGFVGPYVVAALLAQGYGVRVLTRQRQALAHHAWAKQVELIEGDLADASVCQRAVQGVQAVVHLAGLAHVRASETAHKQANLLNTQQLATAAKQADVRSFVYISSCKARYPTHSAYGFYKHASEQHLLTTAAPMHVIVLRPGLIYGKGMKNNLSTLLTLGQRQQLPLWVGSNNAMSLISAGDVAHAITAALSTAALHNRVWELNDGKTYTLTNLITTLRQQQGLPRPGWQVPRALVWLALAVASWVPALRKRGLGLNTYHAVFNEDYIADPAFSQVSGWQPSTDFYQFVRENQQPKHSS